MLNSGRKSWKKWLHDIKICSFSVFCHIQILLKWWCYKMVYKSKSTTFDNQNFLKRSNENNNFKHKKFKKRTEENKVVHSIDNLPFFCV